ncbi:hypothetical protein [Aerococcus vaginalis]
MFIIGDFCGKELVVMKKLLGMSAVVALISFIAAQAPVHAEEAEVKTEWAEEIAPEFGEKAEVVEQWIDREDDDVKYTEEWVDLDAPEAELDEEGHVVSPEKEVAGAVVADDEKAEAHEAAKEAATPAEGATATLPQTGFAAAGLGLGLVMTSIGAAFSFKKH